jgi:hypothetical protein
MTPCHIVRIRGKGARSHCGARFIRAAKEFQDILGADQDAVVAERRLGSLLGQAPRSRLAFGPGGLTERQRTRRPAAWVTFAAVWRTLRRPGKTVSR